ADINRLIFRIGQFEKGQGRRSLAMISEQTENARYDAAQSTYCAKNSTAEGARQTTRCRLPEEMRPCGTSLRLRNMIVRRRSETDAARVRSSRANGLAAQIVRNRRLAPAPDKYAI